ncbi:hypothetical protein CC85DRAFT_151157 [Cutaneotrichosporon oleaginosum]|uniref:Uncharacterized protein n=1 Tax=Cutaneotrichosporon oleaginosum TaxID=879819 RepID=A0A0J1AYM7_9TREE|nr:uncharacterized protein CC85DRAFT_151157 [Cutaneotrichosporon oleaginosum]KLT40414.1 hypothetical protein CC85DRAFT_151157 [Cutaneotrichosporon oleaginosum]TXT11379.1 hypothetical protein COLE_01789 [Cutaneotrichosporon oleaginosum]
MGPCFLLGPPVTSTAEAVKACQPHPQRALAHKHRLACQHIESTPCSVPVPPSAPVHTCSMVQKCMSQHVAVGDDTHPMFLCRVMRPAGLRSAALCKGHEPTPMPYQLMVNAGRLLCCVALYGRRSATRDRRMASNLP